MSNSKEQTAKQDCDNFGSNEYEYMKDCPHCEMKKCSTCDGGDDVGCLSCDDDLD